MNDLEKSKELKAKASKIQERSSLFDSLFDTPWTGPDAGFKGLYMLLIYLVTVGIVIEALVDFSLKGSLFGADLLYKFLNEWQYILCIWLCLCLYSFR